MLTVIVFVSVLNHTPSLKLEYIISQIKLTNSINKVSIIINANANTVKFIVSNLI